MARGGSGAVEQTQADGPLVGIACNEDDCMRLMATASNYIRHGLWAIEYQGPEQYDCADFFLGGLLGLSLLAARLEFEEGERQVRELEAAVGEQGAMKARRMVMGYQAAMADAEATIKGQTQQLELPWS